VKVSAAQLLCFILAPKSWTSQSCAGSLEEEREEGCKDEDAHTAAAAGVGLPESGSEFASGDSEDGSNSEVSSSVLASSRCAHFRTALYN